MSADATPAATRCWACSDPGTVRDDNEDALISRPEAGLWAVADGAGGHQRGELASGAVARALEAVPGGLPPGETLRRLRAALDGVHAELVAEAARQGSATIIATTVVLLLVREGHFACLWAGDSRAYLLRDGALRQITRDHSLVQALVDSGALDARAAERHPQANVITRAVGQAGGELELDKVSGVLLPGDCFLLCSDGLSKTLDEPTIAAAMLGCRTAEPAEDPAWALVARARALRARDNVTAVVVATAG